MPTGNPNIGNRGGSGNWSRGGGGAFRGPSWARPAQKPSSSNKIKSDNQKALEGLTGKRTKPKAASPKSANKQALKGLQYGNGKKK